MDIGYWSLTSLVSLVLYLPVHKVQEVVYLPHRFKTAQILEIDEYVVETFVVMASKGAWLREIGEAEVT